MRSRERTGGRRADVAGDDAVGDVAMGGTEEVEGRGLRSGVVVSIWIYEMRESKRCGEEISSGRRRGTQRKFQVPGGKTWRGVKILKFLSRSTRLF